MSRDTTHRARILGAALAIFFALPAASAAGASERVAAQLARADAPRTQLSAAERVEVPGGGLIHRYVQRIDGLPVFGAESVVVDSPDAPPVLVADSTSPDFDARPQAPVVSERDAIDAAEEAVGARALRAPITARLGIDPQTGNTAWEVMVPSARPRGDFLVTVDARSAKVTGTRDLLWNATGSAVVFNPNPVVAQGNSYAGMKDRDDRDSALLTSLLAPVTLERITSTKGCLSGTYVDSRLGRKAKKVCREGLDFTDLTRSDQQFEAVMAYFHIDRTRAYIDGLGLSEALRLKPQKVSSNAIPEDNSFFSSATRSMTIGEGGVDDGEDADVIIHEYGHSLHDQAVHGFGRSTAAGAIGEGFGDYAAAMMSALTTGADQESSVCIFDWDGISYSPIGCGRRADKGFDIQKAKRKCGLQIHCMGQTWSSALWELRVALGNDSAGRSIMDRVVLESHFMYTPKLSFREAAKALLAADELLYAGANSATIEAEMVERKLCPSRGC